MAKNKPSSTAQFTDAHQKKKKGARRTCRRAHSSYKQLEQCAKEGRWGQITPESITLRQVTAFVKCRLEQGIKIRTIENDLSAIRRAVTSAGRGIDAKHFTRKAVGLPPATRIGKGKPIAPDLMDHVLKNADIRTSILLRVVDALGLRANELVECRDSIAHWYKALEAGTSCLSILRGTKGGRPRSVFIHAEHRAEAFQAIAALYILTDEGREFPIPGAKNGRAAARKFDRMLRKFVISGEQSCQSLRRGFAVRQYRSYLRAGLDVRAALIRVAEDLGHGDKRGRWLLNNYILHGLTEEEKAVIPGRGRPRKDGGASKKKTSAGAKNGE